MTSLVQVCNMALGRLGTHQPISALNEQSQLAQTCSTYLDQARRSLLADFDWPFARVLIDLAETANTPPPPWTFEYARPSNIVRVRSLAPQSTAGTINTALVIPGTASSLDFGGCYSLAGDQPYQGVAQPNINGAPSPTVIPFATGAVTTPTNVTGVTEGVIWTNLAGAQAWCTADVLDPNIWEPGFVNAMSWYLAAEIAVNVTGSAQVQEAMVSGAREALMKGMTAEGNEEATVASWNADWMDARDGYCGGGYGYGGR